MRQGRRYGLSAARSIDIWRRWKGGESLHEIGRAFDKDHGSIQFLLSQHGGIVPAVRRRSPRTLTLAEREEIDGDGNLNSGLQRAAMPSQWSWIDSTNFHQEIPMATDDSKKIPPVNPYGGGPSA